MQIFTKPKTTLPNQMFTKAKIDDHDVYVLPSQTDLKDLLLMYDSLAASDSKPLCVLEVAIYTTQLFGYSIPHHDFQRGKNGWFMICPQAIIWCLQDLDYVNGTDYWILDQTF